MFLLLLCLHSAQKMYFSEIQLVCDRRTNGRTDRRTDTPSYRDARTHLKMPARRCKQMNSFSSNDNGKQQTNVPQPPTFARRCRTNTKEKETHDLQTLNK